MKYITKLTPEEKTTLTEAYQNHPCARVRLRAHALLLNNRGFLVIRIRDLFSVRHQTVSAWLNAWESEGIIGLYDQPRSGRPQILTPEEQERFLAYAKEKPRQTKAAAARVEQETGKQASIDTYNRIIRNQARAESALA
ncbi:MAG: helix-turn-helix domain-containing protein [Methylococcales bacterium]|nr:helix-turn-helix domain-containing protein [Methylococcaceae bacterium]